VSVLLLIAGQREMETLGIWPQFCASNSSRYSCQPDNSADCRDNSQYHSDIAACHASQTSHVCGAHWHGKVKLYNGKWMYRMQHSVILW